MSRLAVTVLGCVLAFPPGAAAQNRESTADRRVQDAISVQNQQASLRKRCLLGTNPAEAIIVCAPRDPESNRLPLRDQTESSQSIKDGLPRAPDVAGNGIFKGKPTIGGLCLVPPCGGKNIYYLDLADIPETPRGSDAERVGKGEIARP
ncbi:MAG: hypothetical protein ABW203_07840 [Novosphingobium sp.]